jgi:hypothetical protein
MQTGQVEKNKNGIAWHGIISGFAAIVALFLSIGNSIILLKNFLPNESMSISVTRKPIDYFVSESTRLSNTQIAIVNTGKKSVMVLGFEVVYENDSKLVGDTTFIHFIERGYEKAMLPISDSTLPIVLNPSQMKLIVIELPDVFYFQKAFESVTHESPNIVAYIKLSVLNSYGEAKTTKIPLSRVYAA